MNRFLHSALTAGIFGGLAAAAWAEPHSVYFNQQGKLTATMPSAAYVRQYQVTAGVAQVQDFYYPSMKKYSDPYKVPAAQIKEFVPVLGNGKLTLWHFNGQKKMVGSYRNGKPDGEWTNWYPNGKKSAVMPYANGLSEGTGSRYYRNGNKESEIQFKKDKANGYWKQWYPDGKPKTEMTMVNDKPTAIITWDEDGRLLSELTIKNGLRNGIVLDWYPDGSKKSESVYQDDRLVEKIQWDEEGYIVE
ncbi:toxin-antitoxin system YwqK family antitoxin [Neisseria animalis]|uniref:Toxin-antitoxin system YwqK family antitoxin n=1 Tax=Neisseria animalis TaxID=492 RepID=A0A5P3MRP3_NEIAN|nr:toxin-antitoxin system YwqK family antitoxin [Neisseria animalis]QEY23309.1 toxin-antitoxin system YwqK family antitoxin [Neisseria animalis]ROW33158.1 toxin-antitoxin system YwqK family antitoxin [Neisseria animalis]VEE08653.1 Periplasmic protein [Neisseria animalis]